MKVKSWTIRSTDGLGLCRSPEFPVRIRLVVPVHPPRAVLTVMVVEPDPAMVGEAKLACAPNGRPDTPKPTVPVKPFCAETVTVYDAAAPATTVETTGATLMVKLGGGVTERENTAVDHDPSVPATRMVGV